MFFADDQYKLMALYYKHKSSITLYAGEMGKEWNKISFVPVTLPLTQFLREIFCSPNRKQVFSLQNWQQNIYQLIRIHPNTRYPNNMANSPALFGELKHSAGLKVMTSKLGLRVMTYENFEIFLEQITILEWKYFNSNLCWLL